MLSHFCSNDEFDKYDEMKLHMKQLLSASIVEFDLPARITYPLGDAGIRTLGDLIKHDRNSLMGIRMLGIKAVGEIEKCLNRIGLTLSNKK